MNALGGIRNFIDSQQGRMFLSIILGIGLATLFKKSCSGKGCFRFIGPDIKKMENKIYKFNEKCYTYKPSAETCNKNKKQVHFETKV